MIIRCKKESGFTLLELLIAIMIMGIVFAAVMKIFSTNYRSYVLQDDVATMQENLRIGMMFLQKDLQMIGSGMTGGDVVSADTTQIPNIGFQGIITKQKGSSSQYVLSGGRAYSITFQNGTGDETDRKKGSDRISVQYIKMPDLADFNSTDTSCEESNKPCTCGNGANPCDKLPSLIGTLTGSAFTMSTQSNPAIFTAWATKWQNGTCSCKDGENELQPKNLVIITGFTANNQWGADIVPIAPNGIAGTTITLNAPTVNSYPQGVTINFFNPKNFVNIDYFVAPDGSLKRDANDNAGAQDVAENIEDLQFAFGVDTNNDGTVDQWIWNQSLDPANNPNDSLSALNIRMIRVSLLGRTDRPNNTFYTGIRNAIRQAQAATPSPGSLEDHNVDVIEANAPAVAQPGRFYVWKLNQTTINVRNMGTP